MRDERDRSAPRIRIDPRDSPIPDPRRMRLLNELVKPVVTLDHPSFSFSLGVSSEDRELACNEGLGGTTGEVTTVLDTVLLNALGGAIVSASIVGRRLFRGVRSTDPPSVSDKEGERALIVNAASFAVALLIVLTKSPIRSPVCDFPSTFSRDSSSEG
jgi:hypothetical protein